MPLPAFPDLSKVDPADSKQILDALAKIKKELEWLVQSLDTQNIASLSGEKIDPGTVGTDQLADEAVTAPKIAALAIGEAHIQNAAITNAKIANASIDSAKIAHAAIDKVHIKEGVIDETLIADGSITDAKIVSLTANKIIGGTIDTGQVTVQGPNGKLRITSNRLQVFDNQQIPVERVSIGDVNGDGTVYGLRVRGADGKTILYDHNGVYSEGITDGAITNPKIADGAVDTRVIAANAVTADKIVAGAVTTEKIAANAVTASKIAANTITAGSAIIADGAITTAKIADGAITNAKIANATITGAKIADATITGAKIAKATITDAHITNLSANKITSGTLDARYVNVINLNASNITAGYLSADRISGGTLTGVNINVSSDVTVGNNIYIGSPASSSLKSVIFGNRARIIGNVGPYFSGIQILTHDGLLLGCEAGGWYQITCTDDQNPDGISCEFFQFSSPYYTGINNQGHPMIRAKGKMNAHAGALKFISGTQAIQARTYNDNAYIPVAASAFQQASSADLKQNIKDFSGSAMEIIRRARVRKFVYKSAPTEERIGFLADEAPFEFKCRADDGSISLGDVVAVLVKAVQELDARLFRIEESASTS